MKLCPGWGGGGGVRGNARVGSCASASEKRTNLSNKQDVMRAC